MQRRLQNPAKRLSRAFYKNSEWLKADNYFWKMFHLRCMTGFWKRLWYASAYRCRLTCHWNHLALPEGLMNLALSIRPSVCPSATVFSQEWLIFFYPKEDPFICGFLFKSFQNTYGQLFLMPLMFLTFQLFLHVEKRMYEHAKVYSNYKKKIY